MSTFIHTTQSYVQGSRTMPRERFVSEENFTREQERIIGQQWLCVGRAEQIPNAGDYFLFNIGVESLILVRDRECMDPFSDCSSRCGPAYGMAADHQRAA